MNEAQAQAQQKAQIRAQFNGIAAQYDAAGPGNFAHFGRRLVSLAGVGVGQRVLDVATGRGAALFPAADQVGPGGEVVGIDLSDAMVQATADEAARRNLPARVLVMDAEQLDFPDATFDHVLCGFGLMFFPDLPGALAEFRRVLEPAGRLAVSTWHVSQAEDLSAVIAGFGLGSGSPPGWINEPAELERRLRDAGFANVSVQVDSETFRYADLEEYWQNARGTGLRARIDSLDADQTARVREALAERLRTRQRPNGLYVAASALIGLAER